MDIVFSFADRNDARRYLGEVGALWTVWIASMFVVTFSTGGMRAIFGLVGLVATVWRTAPLQRRALELVPDNTAVKGAGFRGGPRETTFRKLAYGAEPLRSAVPTAQASPVWYALRLGMLGVTIVGFAFVVFGYLA